VRLLPFCLSALLVSAGCYTTRPLTHVELRQQLGTSGAPLTLMSADGATVRVDPNTDLRFVLRSGEVTEWIQGRDLWRSELGLSYETRDGAFFVAWDELAGVEVRNLSGGKTFLAVLGVVAAIALVVIAIASKGGLGGSGGSSGGSKKHAETRRVVRRPLPRHSRGGVHVHVPLAIALVAAPDPYPHDAPPPPPLPAPPPPAVAGGEVVDIDGPGPATPAAPAKPRPTRTEATRLFEGSIRRTSQVEFFGHAGAGTELARVEGYTGSLVLGLRVRETFEIGGGVRHTLAPLPPSRGGDLDTGLIGIGRVGGNFWVDDHHWFAIPLSIDGGAGYQVLYHLRLNCGLRFSPIRNLSIGLLPFNPSFIQFREDSEFAGAKRWTFPTTVEVGFVF